MAIGRGVSSLVIFLLAFPSSLLGEERTVGKGEHRGFIVNEGEQVLKVSPIKPGQTLQAFLSPQWTAGPGSKVQWILADSTGARLRTARQRNPEAETILMEWTSNSDPKPDGYLIQVRGEGGKFPGEILGQYSLRIALWDQNDGDSGTDAPESYEKALNLPLPEAGNYFFNECFLSGTADVYDIYKMAVQPNHSLTLKVKPMQWNGVDRKGKFSWEFLNKSFKQMKAGSCRFPEKSPFGVKVFHPQVKSGSRPALFYLLVKIEGDVSLIYGLEVEVKEGR